MGITEIRALFPGIPNDPNRITSLSTPNYNCIAWAAGDTERWWWPDPELVSYWPSGVLREPSVSAMVSAFQTLGYIHTEIADRESGLEKVAIYAHLNAPTHVARQLEDGFWTSKLGKLEDIRHQLEELEGDRYGQVCHILSRPRAR